MARQWAETLAGWLAWSQDGVIAALEATDPSLVRQRPSRSAPSIAFHAWHLARWADRHHVAIAGWLDLTGAAPTEIWVANDLATAWGITTDKVGDLGIGAGLDDDASAALPLPDVEVLSAYVTDAFAGLIAMLGRIPDDAALDRRVVDLHGVEDAISEVLLGLLSHTDRHLGMIEAVRGVLGERGTATD